MKKYFTYLILLTISLTQAQVLIDDTTTPNEAPDASAVLELRSDSKGLLLPRLNTAPVNPVEGLVYWDSNGNCFRGYANGDWQPLGPDCVFPTPENYTISISDATSVEEGVDQTFTVTISPAVITGHEIKVSYSSIEDTATEGSDYAAADSFITFTEGETSKVITVSTTDDALEESNESYNILIGEEQFITGSGSLNITNDTATGIIIDNDATAQGIIISEIADPNNDESARFIELYNIGNTAVDISGYTLKRWTNANNTPTASSNITIPANTSLAAGDTYVVVADESVFMTFFGSEISDLEGGVGGPVDSNGDDNIGLFDETDTLIDFYGVIGEDGTGTCHEFEDGRALRKPGITSGATTWNESEWTVWADSTVSGCTSHTNNPQDAPNDFTPGSHTN